MNKICNYFPHDFNARNDLKLKRVRMNMGMEGIGLYWSIVECLYEKGGYLTLDEDLDLLSYELRVDKEKIINLIENYDLFKKNKNKFYSQSVMKRLKKISDKSKKNRENVLKRWEKSKNDKVLRNENENNTTVSNPNYYIKENKNKKKENNIYNLTTTDINNIYYYVTENFERDLTPLEETKINNLLSEVGEEKLRLAINIAVMNQKKTFAYVDGIIKNWHAKGLNTIEEIKEDELHSKIVSSSNVQSKKALQELNDYNWLEDEEE